MLEKPEPRVHSGIRYFQASKLPPQDPHCFPSCPNRYFSPQSPHSFAADTTSLELRPNHQKRSRFLCCTQMRALWLQLVPSSSIGTVTHFSCLHLFPRGLLSSDKHLSVWQTLLGLRSEVNSDHFLSQHKFFSFGGLNELQSTTVVTKVGYNPPLINLHSSSSIPTSFLSTPTSSTNLHLCTQRSEDANALRLGSSSGPYRLSVWALRLSMLPQLLRIHSPMIVTPY